VTQRHHDETTDRRLRPFVGLIVVCATVAVGWALYQLAAEMRTKPTAAACASLLGLVLALVVMAAFFAVLRIRIGAVTLELPPVSASLLICVAFANHAVVILACFVGTTLARIVLRQRDLLKLGYNVGKETVAAAAATFAAGAVGLQTMPLSGHHHPAMLQTVVGLLAATVAYGIVDETLGISLLSMVTHRPLSKLLLMHLDARLLSRAGSLILAATTVWLYSVNPWLVSIVVPSVYAIHLTSANRVRRTQEHEAWQQLARATDELNAVDLGLVLSTAVRRAAELFSADEVEVEVRPPDGEPRLVRGDRSAVSYAGPLAEAPPAGATTFVIPVPLESYQGDADLGVLRLRFRGEVKLIERERYTLRTFAAAVCTAVRNAETFAKTERLADSHARAAAQDPLTGLANRRRLLQYGTEVLSAVPARGVAALLLIDLNHFKEVNDTLGHAAGDKVLVDVAARLAGAIQEHDLVARLGGDEFAVLLVGLSAPAVAESRANAVLGALSAPIDLDGMRISVEASGGVATAASSGGIGELLRRADVAMYQAKRDGQRVVADSATRDTADVGSLTLGGDLVRAIHEREFTVNFQPIVDLGTGEAIGAEALTRWHHPDRGDLTPDRFLDAVERSGQLAAFADAVLDQALVAAAEWAEAGFPIPVAVNVSARSLLDPAFPEAVRSRLAAHNLPAEILVVELTESITLSQLEVVDEVLGALRGMGIKLALDDFGTGYSSLATLARVPVDELKIDRGFVSEMDLSAPGAVIRSTIELGRSLDLLVVAEGVERDDQRLRLWELGCPAGQGHLFARAMPADRLLAALHRGCGGRPGSLALPLHEEGAVIRMPMNRRNRLGQTHLGG
jgi:diguanylate cyclase (GGDEF)-like protein